MELVLSMVALLELTTQALAPATRDRYTYPDGIQASPVSVNPTGVDLHVGQVGPVAHDNPDTPNAVAHAYAVLWPWPGNPNHGRLARGRSLSRWRFQLTIAAGDPHDALPWAIDLIRDTLDGHRLAKNTGSLRQILSPGPARPDESVKPVRWVTFLEYQATLH